MTPPALEVRDLRVVFRTAAGPVTAVDGLDLSVAPGTLLGVVGESGSGKTAAALALLGLHDPRTTAVTGRIAVGGTDLVRATEAERRRIRGDRIAMVFQDAATALHPMLRVGDQIAGPLRHHRGLSRRDARDRAVEALRAVGVPAPERRARQHPHELSGGMRQRVMIAMALALEPEVLVADEPTTALDATVQAQVLALIDGIRRGGTAVVLISHSLATVAEVADDVLVMYAGRAAEHGPRAEVLGAPRHPYTRALLEAAPRLDGPRRLPAAIPGAPPRPAARPGGCAFHPRCPHAAPECRSHVPAARAAGPGHAVACHLVAVTPDTPVAGAGVAR